MNFQREHSDLKVVLLRDRQGHIVKADLSQPIYQRDETGTVDLLQLTAAQLYALVDDIAVADPESWSKRFDPRDAVERHLRSVASYFRERAEANDNASQRVNGPTRRRYESMSDAFSLAATRCMEEIEALYDGEPHKEELTLDQRRLAQAAVQRYHVNGGA